MKYLDSIRRAARSLKNAKARTALTSLAIAVGAFTLTLSLAAGEGARQYADNLLKNNIDPRALFIVKDKSITSTSPGRGIREYSDDLSSTSTASGSSVAIEMITNADVEKLRGRSDISEVVPIYSLTSQYITVEGNAKKYITALSYYDASVLGEVQAGTLPKLGEQINDDEILLPEEYLETLGVSASQLVGKKITVRVGQSVAAPSQDEITKAFMSGGNQAVQDLLMPQTRDYVLTIRAVLKKPAMAIVSSPQLLISTNTAQQIFDYETKGTDNAGKYFGVTAIAKGDSEVVKNALQKEYGYSVQTAKDAQGLLFTIVNILQGIVIGFGVIALIASIFGIINTQYISVLERTREIGLMKALGMRRRHVSRLFQLEAAWIGFLGGILGAGLAWGIGTAMNPWITRQLSLGDGNSLLIFQFIPVVLLIASLILIAMLAGWFPSRKAAKLDPIEALRTE